MIIQIATFGNFSKLFLNNEKRFRCFSNELTLIFIKKLLLQKLQNIAIYITIIKNIKILMKFTNHDSSQTTWPLHLMIKFWSPTYHSFRHGNEATCIGSTINQIAARLNLSKDFLCSLAKRFDGVIDKARRLKTWTGKHL